MTNRDPPRKEARVGASAKTSGVIVLETGTVHLQGEESNLCRLSWSRLGFRVEVSV